MSGVSRVDISKKWDGEIVKACCNKFTSAIVFDIGVAVERQAKLLAARNYGQLAASIMTKSSTQKHDMENPSKYQEHAMPSDIAERAEPMKEIQAPTDPNVALVGTAMKQGWFTEFGTAPHEINSPVKIHDKWVYIGWHPGTDAQPFLRPAKAMVADGEVLEQAKIEGKKHFLGYLYEHEAYLRQREAEQGYPFPSRNK